MAIETLHLPTPPGWSLMVCWGLMESDRMEWLWHLGIVLPLTVSFLWRCLTEPPAPACLACYCWTVPQLVCSTMRKMKSAKIHSLKITH